MSTDITNSLTQKHWDGTRWRGFWLASPIAALTLIPLWAVVWLGLSPQEEVWQHLTEHVLPRVLGNTALLMVLVSITVLLVGVPLAWLTAICEFPARRFFAWALVLPLALPAYVLAFVQMGLLEFTGPIQTAIRAWWGDSQWFPQIRGSLWGLVLVLTLAFYPYVYLLARSAFLTQGQRCMEVAQSLGLSPWKAFWRVALPLARPWIGAGLALVLMEVLADFGAIAVFNFDTFTTALYKAWFDLHNMAAAAQLACVLLLVVLSVVVLEQRSQGARRYQVGIVRQQRVQLHGVQAWGATAFCGFIFAWGFAIPIAQLIWWASQEWSHVLDEHYWDYALNTLLLAVLTAAIAATLSLLLSWIARRYPSEPTRWMVRLAILGYALPGVVLAVGIFVPIAWLDSLLIDLLKPFGINSLGIIKGSLASMLLALSARFLAVAFGAVDSAMQRVTRSQEDACASLGLTSWQTLRRLHLPLLRTGLLSAALMVGVDVMKEMPITLMTRQFGWDTLAVRVFQYTSESMWEMASLPALAIVLVGLVPVIILVRHSEGLHS